MPTSNRTNTNARVDQDDDDELVEELELTGKPVPVDQMTPAQREAWAIFQRELDVYIRETAEGMAEHFAEYDAQQEKEKK